MSIYSNAGSPKRLVASGAVLTDMGCIIGIFCNGAGSVALADAASAAEAAAVGNVIGPLTMTTGQFLPLPIAVSKGLYATIAGADMTFLVA